MAKAKPAQPRPGRKRKESSGLSVAVLAVAALAVAGLGYYALSSGPGSVSGGVTATSLEAEAAGQGAPGQAAGGGARLEADPHAAERAAQQETCNAPAVEAEAEPWAHVEFFQDPSEVKDKFRDPDGTRSSWYHGAASKWDKEEKRSYNAVMGGYGHLNSADVRGSLALLERWMGDQFEEQAAGRRSLVALDVGAGVGRVSQELLLPMFTEVDVLEPTATLLATAKWNLTQPDPRRPEGHRAVNFFEMGIEAFTPQAGRYDCVWVQWCLMYAHDEDVIAFLSRAKAGLKPDGHLFVKENVANDLLVVDTSDHSMSRTAAHFEALFTQAGYSVLDRKVQGDFDPELYEVHMWALEPTAGSSSSSRDEL